MSGELSIKHSLQQVLGNVVPEGLPGKAVLRAALEPGPDFQATARRIVQGIRTATGHPDFVVVHMRVEADFVDATKSWQLQVLEAECVYVCVR